MRGTPRRVSHHGRSELVCSVKVEENLFVMVGDGDALAFS